MIFESLQINKITYLVEENDLVLAFVLTEANIDKRIVTSQIIIKIIIKVSFYANNLFETRAAVQGESRNNNIFCFSCEFYKNKHKAKRSIYGTNPIRLNLNRILPKVLLILLVHR